MRARGVFEHRVHVPVRRRRRRAGLWRARARGRGRGRGRGLRRQRGVAAGPTGAVAGLQHAHSARLAAAHPQLLLLPLEH